MRVRIFPCWKAATRVDPSNPEAGRLQVNLHFLIRLICEVAATTLCTEQKLEYASFPPAYQFRQLHRLTVERRCRAKSAGIIIFAGSITPCSMFILTSPIIKMQSEVGVPLDVNSFNRKAAIFIRSKTSVPLRYTMGWKGSNYRGHGHPRARLTALCRANRQGN